MQRPGILTKCGHVYCSQCIEDICKMNPPHHNGFCPTCRSKISLKKIILYNLDVLDVDG